MLSLSSFYAPTTFSAARIIIIVHHHDDHDHDDHHHDDDDHHHDQDHLRRSVIQSCPAHKDQTLVLTRKQDALHLHLDDVRDDDDQDDCDDDEAISKSSVGLLPIII